jgi:hypothetical protein
MLPIHSVIKSYLHIDDCLEDSLLLKRPERHHTENSTHPIFHNTTASVYLTEKWPPPRQPTQAKDHRNAWQRPQQTPPGNKVHQNEWEERPWQQPGNEGHQNVWQCPQQLSGNKVHRNAWHHNLTSPDATRHEPPKDIPSAPTPQKLQSETTLNP